MNPPVVLIFVESDALRRAIATHLSTTGYATAEARTVPEAVATLDRGETGVVIFGHSVREADDAITFLRRLSSTGEAPVVLIMDPNTVRRLPPDALPAVVEVLAWGRYSIAELDRVVAHALRKG